MGDPTHIGLPRHRGYAGAVGSPIKIGSYKNRPIPPKSILGDAIDLGQAGHASAARHQRRLAQVDGQPWAKSPPAPALPQAVIDGTAAKYREALQRLLG